MPPTQQHGVKMCLRVHAQHSDPSKSTETCTHRQQPDVLLHCVYQLSDVPTAANAFNSCNKTLVTSVRKCWQHVSTKTSMQAVTPELRARIEHLLSTPLFALEGTVQLPAVQLALHIDAAYVDKDRNSRQSIFVGSSAVTTASSHELLTNLPTLHLTATESNLTATLTAVITPQATPQARQRTQEKASTARPC